MEKTKPKQPHPSFLAPTLKRVFTQSVGREFSWDEALVDPRTENKINKDL